MKRNQKRSKMNNYASNSGYYIGQIPMNSRERPSSSKTQNNPVIVRNYLQDYGANNQSHYSNNPNQGTNSNNRSQYSGFNDYKGRLPNLSESNSNARQKFLMDENDEVLEDKFTLILNMWDDLGVTPDYRNHFQNVAYSLNDKDKQAYYENESDSLKKFRNCLIKLCKEINNREDNIEKLRQYNEIITTTFYENREELSDTMMNNVLTAIKEIRIHSVNVINHFITVREISSYQIMNEKYDLNKVNKAYKLDKDYLLRMKSDLDFVRLGGLLNYFETTDEELDTFLMNISSNQFSSDKNLKTIPIEDDLLKAIKRCQYIIREDQIYNRTQGKAKYGNAFHSPMNKANYDSQSMYPKIGGLSRAESAKGSRGGSSRPGSAKTALGGKMNMNRTLYNLNRKDPVNYKNMFYNQNQGNESFNRTSKESMDNQQYNQGYFGGYTQPLKSKGRIKIEHEEVNQMSGAEFIKRMEEYDKLNRQKNPYIGKQRYPSMGQDRYSRDIHKESYGNIDYNNIPRAIKETFDIDIKILDYEEHALQGGANAQAAAYIHMLNMENGSVTYGVGVSSNITRASVYAIFSAMMRNGDCI